MKMNGTVDITEEETKARESSPTKKSAAALQAEALYMTKDKVLIYAKDIIKSIKERLEQLDDPHASPLDFGVEQIFLSPTVQASFDMYGQATGSSAKSNELYLA